MLYKCFEDKIKNFRGSKATTWVLFILTIVCIVIGFFFYPKNTFYYVSNLVLQTEFGFILLRYLLSLIASICALYWSFRLYGKNENKKLVKYLMRSGQDTLFLYCSHVLILSYAVNTIVDSNYGTNGLLSDYPVIKYYLVAPIVSVVLYYLLYSLAVYLKQFSFLRVLFLGLPAK